MSGLPDPERLTWLEADEYQRILSEAAAELRAQHPHAARVLDYRAQACRMRRNHLAETGA